MESRDQDFHQLATLIPPIRFSQNQEGTSQGSSMLGQDLQRLTMNIFLQQCHNSHAGANHISRQCAFLIKKVSELKETMDQQLTQPDQQIESQKKPRNCFDINDPLSHNQQFSLDIQNIIPVDTMNIQEQKKPNGQGMKTYDAKTLTKKHQEASQFKKGSRKQILQQCESQIIPQASLATLNTNNSLNELLGEQVNSQQPLTKRKRGRPKKQTKELELVKSSLQKNNSSNTHETSPTNLSTKAAQSEEQNFKQHQSNLKQEQQNFGTSFAPCSSSSTNRPLDVHGNYNIEHERHYSQQEDYNINQQSQGIYYENKQTLNKRKAKEIQKKNYELSATQYDTKNNFLPHEQETTHPYHKHSKSMFVEKNYGGRGNQMQMYLENNLVGRSNNQQMRVKQECQMSYIPISNSENNQF